VSPSITWRGLDARSAEATIRHGGVTASATFVFDAQGRPVELRAERYNDARGRPEPWRVPLRAYGERGGACIPVEGEARWAFSTGDFTYIRWRITEIEPDRPSPY
jgi:hypothetical protein